MKEQTQIKLTRKDGKALAKILSEAKTKLRPKLKKLIENYI